jgi:hypothetical protein
MLTNAQEINFKKLDTGKFLVKVAKSPNEVKRQGYRLLLLFINTQVDRAF